MSRDGEHRGRWGSLAMVVLATALFISEGVAPATALGALPGPVLVSITVTPSGATIDPEATQQFTATGTYSDLSTQSLTAAVTWTTSDTSVATISNAAGSKGLATGVAEGGVGVTATDPASGTSGTALLAVAPVPPPPPPPPPPPVTLASLAVTPTGATIDPDATQQYSATGTYSDLSTRDLTGAVTWASSDPTLATISNAAGTDGRATGVAPGGVTITATDPVSGVPGTALLAVNPPPVVPPVVTPPLPGTARIFTVAPGAGGPGTRVEIVGVRFPAGRKVKLSYVTGVEPHRVKLCKTTIAIDGAFSCAATIPRSVAAGPAGTHTVIAKTVRSPGMRATTATFTLVR